MKREWYRHHSLYVMLLLPLSCIILFKYVPIYGIQIAFRDYKITSGITTSPWVGLENFQRFLESYMFAEIMRNTIRINLYSLVLFPLPLIFALLINYMPSRRFKKSIQTVSYAPHFISTVVICAMILQFTDPRNGLINAIIVKFGGQEVNLIAKPEYFASLYVWTGEWQRLGYSSIIYVSALAGVSPELHEAAIMDGASILKRIWHVDIPTILPTFCILLVLRCGSLLGVGYEKVYLLQNNLNLEASEVISTYTYKIGIASSSPEYSYSTAIGQFVSVINVTMLMIVNYISRRLSGSSLW